MLRQVVGADGESRFGMLQTIREYALEHLEASGEGERLRRRHAKHYLASVAAVQQQFRRSQQRVSLTQLAVEMDNIRTALHWVLERGEVELGLGMAEAAFWFWWAPGLWSTWRQWHEALRTRRDTLPPPLRAKALTLLGHYLGTQSDHMGALPLLEEGLALSREAGDQAGIGQTLRYVADVHRDQGAYEQADQLYQESLLHYQALGDRHGSAWVYHGWGEMARLQGDFTRALALGEASLGLFRELGQTLGICHAVLNHGFVEQARGNDEQAATLYKESLLLARTLENPLFVAQCLIGFAGVAVKDPVGPVNAAAAQRAARLLGAAEVMLAASPGPLFHVPRREYERNIAAARTQLDDATFAAAWAEGRAMTLEQAAAYALEEAAEATACPRCTGSGPG
jgi:tetratricopeptide (TPR) repeat protein